MITTIVDPDEQRLLTAYRQLRPEQQQAVLILLRLALDRPAVVEEEQPEVMLTFD